MIGWIRRRRAARERPTIVGSVLHGGDQYIGQVIELRGTGKPFLARVVGAPSSTVLTIKPVGRWSSFWWRARRALRGLFRWRR